MKRKQVWNGWPPLSVKWDWDKGCTPQETYFDFELGWQEREVSWEWLSECPKHQKPWTLYRFKNKAGASCSRWECFEENRRTKTGRCVIRPSRVWSTWAIKKEAK